MLYIIVNSSEYDWDTRASFDEVYDKVFEQNMGYATIKAEKESDVTDLMKELAEYRVMKTKQEKEIEYFAFPSKYTAPMYTKKYFRMNRTFKQSELGTYNRLPDFY